MRRLRPWYAAVLLLAVTIFVPASSPAAAPASAQACTLTPTSGMRERTIGSRRYEVYVPASIPTAQAMLVVSLHGGTLIGFGPDGQPPWWPITEFPQPESQAGLNPTPPAWWSLLEPVFPWPRNLSYMNQAADRYKFIVAYPVGDSTRNPLPDIEGALGLPTFGILNAIVRYIGWETTERNSDNGSENPPNPNADLTFILDVIRDVFSIYCVDPLHVHVEGLSMGAGMTQRMACEAANVIASVSSLGARDVESTFGTVPSDDCVPSRGISVMLNCDDQDALCGSIPGTSPRFYEGWRQRLLCPPTPTTTFTDTFGTLRRFDGCRDNRVLLARTWSSRNFPGWQVHLYPPRGPALDKYHEEMWQFFAFTPRP